MLKVVNQLEKWLGGGRRREEKKKKKAVLPEDLLFMTPSTHIVAHNHQFQSTWHLIQASMDIKHTCGAQPHIHKNIEKNF